jgi:hypothetical protein
MQKHKLEYCVDDCDDEDFEDEDFDDDEEDEEEWFDGEIGLEEDKSYFLTTIDISTNVKTEREFPSFLDAMLYLRNLSLKSYDPVPITVYFYEFGEPVNISYFNGKLRGGAKFLDTKYIITIKENKNAKID